MKNAIGLDKEKSALLADKLNVLLANYQMFYINARGFHWNIRGEKFFELHGKFEELYNDAVLKIDEIAERILTLGHIPLHTFSDYLEQSSIEPAKELHDGRACVAHVLTGLQQLLEIERDILHLSDDAGDEGTNAQMSDYITAQEKTVWMYHAFLS